MLVELENAAELIQQSSQQKFHGIMKRQFISLLVATLVIGFHSGQRSKFRFCLLNEHRRYESVFGRGGGRFNGDGKMDLVSGQYGLQTLLTVLTNNGNGTFSLCSTNGLNGGALFLWRRCGGFQPGRQNGIWFACTKRFRDHLTMLTNDGGGHFTEWPIRSTQIHFRQLRFARQT